jgi:hypothetical protein
MNSRVTYRIITGGEGLPVRLAYHPFLEVDPNPEGTCVPDVRLS